ncbi:MAG: DUF1398 family protein [Polyangiales bacterium]
MEQRVKDLIEDCARASHAGTRQFAQIVAALIEAGVEGYQADYRARSTTYYLPSGEAHSVALPAPAVAIPAQLDAGALQQAIRGSQRGEVRYPEFLTRSMDAGCVGYHVFFVGRHVAYFGRAGQQHIERFPD